MNSLLYAVHTVFQKLRRLIRTHRTSRVRILAGMFGRANRPFEAHIDDLFAKDFVDRFDPLPVRLPQFMYKTFVVFILATIPNNALD